MSKRRLQLEGHEPDCPAVRSLRHQLALHPLDRRMVLRGALLGAGVLAVPGLAACTSSGSSAAPAPAGTGSFAGSRKSTKDTLTIAASETPASIDWDLYLDPVSFQSYNNVYNTPLTWQKVPSQGTPNIVTSDFRNLAGMFAEDWEFSKDGTSLTLRFKKGVMSHAGNELGAKGLLLHQGPLAGNRPGWHVPAAHRRDPGPEGHEDRGQVHDQVDVGDRTEPSDPNPQVEWRHATVDC